MQTPESALLRKSTLPTLPPQWNYMPVQLITWTARECREVGVFLNDILSALFIDPVIRMLTVHLL
jgi:hypothetical protein